MGPLTGPCVSGKKKGVQCSRREGGSVLVIEKLQRQGKFVKRKTLGGKKGRGCNSPSPALSSEELREDIKHTSHEGI